MTLGFVVGVLARGGAELQLMALARGLAGRGHDVGVLAYDGPSPFDDELRAAGVTLDIAHGRGRWHKLRLVRSWMRRSDRQVVHGILTHASAAAILARWPGRFPAVVASDFSTASYFRHDRVQRLALMTYGMADRVVTESEHNRAELERLVPGTRGKTVVIRNGLDTERFAPARSGAASQATFRFCVVGTVHAVKNPSGVIDAVVELRRRGHRDFRVDWYGRMGGHPNGSEGEVVRARAQGLGAASNLFFHGDTARIEQAYRQADALLHVSAGEGMPNAVAEGLASGLPVVLSRVSDLPAIVATADNGFVCDETDPFAIADAMERLMRCSAREREAMGRRSRELAERWFGMERFLQEHEVLYGSCIESQAPVR